MATLSSRISSDPAAAANYFAREIEARAMGPHGAGQAIVDRVLDRALVNARTLAHERLNPRANPLQSNFGTRSYRNSFSVRTALPDGRGRVRGRLTNSHPAARAVENGTRPHEIRPREAKMLAFAVPDGWVGRTPGGPKIRLRAPQRVRLPGANLFPTAFEGRKSTTSYQPFGEVVFPSVEHPGAPAFHIMRDAVSTAIRSESAVRG